MDYDREAEFSVRPGLIVPQQGSHEVVWWDPSKLKLGEEGDHGLRQEELLKDDGGASSAAYHAWREQRAKIIEAASRPEFAVFLASQAPDAPPDPVLGRSRRGEACLARGPTGRRFGTLVHAVLRDVPLDADRATIRQWAQLNARIVGAPAEEIEAACCPRGGRAARIRFSIAHGAAERKHREYPVMLRVDGGPAHGRHHRSCVRRKRRLGDRRLQDRRGYFRPAATNTSASFSGTRARSVA